MRFLCALSVPAVFVGRPAHVLFMHLQIASLFLAKNSLFHALANCPSRNSFLSTFMHRTGGLCTPPNFPTFQRFNVQTSQQSPITSHLPHPLFQTEQPSAPSLMHIITGPSSFPLRPGDRPFPCLGGRYVGQAPHHPYRRRRLDCPASH